VIYKGVKIPDLKPSCERNTNRTQKKKNQYGDRRKDRRDAQRRPHL